MDASTPSHLVIHSLAVAYSEAVYFARQEVFEELCHEAFAMTEITPEGGANYWDKAGYLARVTARDPFPGDASYEILSVDVAGNEIARVHLWVDVPPRRYEDHLGFVRIDGTWKLLTKVFRTKERLDQSA